MRPFDRRDDYQQRRALETENMVLRTQFGYAMSEARENPSPEDKVKDEFDYYGVY